jgi:hypothetical protein
VQGQIGNPGAARSCSAKADGFRVSAAQTNDSLRRKAQTEFGLQPFQNRFRFQNRRDGLPTATKQANDTLKRS